MSNPRLLQPKEAFRKAIKDAGFESSLDWEDADGFKDHQFKLTVTGYKGMDHFAYRTEGRAYEVEDAYRRALAVLKAWLEEHKDGDNRD